MSSRFRSFSLALAVVVAILGARASGTRQVTGVHVNAGVAPVVSSFTPTSGAVSTSVTITGFSFGATQGTSTVTFNGTAGTPTSWADSTIVVPVPVGAATGAVAVTVGTKTSTGGTFTVSGTGGQSQFVTCTTTLANLSQATVQSAVNAAADGAVICLPAGSAAWTSPVSFSLTKAVTIAGQAIVTGGSGTSTLTGTSAKFQWPPTANSSKSYRVGGFTISQTGGSNLVYMCPGGDCGVGTISHFRLDHNSITMSAGGAIVFIGDGGVTKEHLFGVMDHNTVTSPAVFYAAYGFNQEDAAPPTTNALGNSNNFFLEDNTFSATTIDNEGLGCTDGWGAIAVVVRYNTFTNCRTLMHAVTHQGGPANFELYGNTYIQTSNTSGSTFTSDGTRTIHEQGAGTSVVFGNIIGSILAHGTDGIVLQHYRSFTNGSDGTSPYGQCDGTKSVDGNRAPSATNHGYPCWRQPARNILGVYKPIYSWSNKWSSDNTRIDMVYASATGASDFTSSQVVANREWYNGVSLTAQTQNGASGPFTPFNGTTGMGFGRLVDRPTTCTTSTETAFGNGAAGVGYFATDQGTWFNGGAGGVLYTCSATNTWTVYYTPYTYPYPWP